MPIRNLQLLPSCGEKQTEYGPAGEVRIYLDELKDILLRNYRPVCACQHLLIRVTHW